MVGTTGIGIGVFGGTFDPPHVAHLVAALHVRAALALERVLFVVANQPWQKVADRDITTAVARLAMVEAAVAGVDGLEADDREIRRGGPSYSVETLHQIREEHPGADLWLVLGRDAAAGLPTWERAEQIASLCRLAVVDRPGSERLRIPPGYEWERVVIPRLDISSTDLRDRVATGRPIRFLVPDPVIDCIEERGLYRGPRHEHERQRR